MQDFVYSHAPVESAKATNLHDLSSDWINLKEKTIRNRTIMFYCLWKAHVEKSPHTFFSFHGMFSLCAVKTYVENIPWKPGLTFSVLWYRAKACSACSMFGVI